MSYIPNKLPLRQRLLNKLGALFLLIYGGYGLYINDLFIPGRRSRGIHLHDEAAVLMYAAFVCASLLLISLVIDHYDERDNEHKYRIFASGCQYLGWALFACALIWHLMLPG